MTVEPKSGGSWRAHLTKAGCLEQIEVVGSEFPTRIGFRTDSHRGPMWRGEWDGRLYEIVLSGDADDPLAFTGAASGLHFGLRYEALAESLVVHATLRNTGFTPFRPVTCGLRLGIDTYMEQFPEWNDKLFPTLLRCEATHFWGYCMSPRGAILGIASPDPVASWSLNYNRARYGDYGHRIYTANLDLMNAGPLPARHPLLDELLPGAERTWRIHLVPITTLDEVKSRLSELTQAPLIDVRRLTLMPGDRERIRVVTGEAARVEVINPEGIRSEIGLVEDGFEFVAPERHGAYIVLAEVASGRRSEARLFVRPPWTWYLRQARVESLRIPQKACSHSEGWLGLYTQVHARRLVPDAVLDGKSEQVFGEIVPEMFDLELGEPRYFRPRIFNSAYMAGVFAARFRCNGNVDDLRIAARLVDFIIQSQDPDGAYLGSAGTGAGTVHYTCVAYPAKSIMEVCMAESTLAAEDSAWRERHDRHISSVRRAMDNLVQQLDDIDTEGELTFEDGMISCAATQLSLFALLQSDVLERERYRRAAETLLERHRCLDQLLIPDSRMNGGTLRFWEAQYDVLLYPNMMNSPHGWTSWKTYGTWYLYLLTGRVTYLEETMNALGAGMQMIDHESGILRWAFVPDPYIRADQFGVRTHRDPDGQTKQVFIEDPGRPGSREAARRVLGEQYVDMVSDVYAGWCCDNDVHEHFKCLAEVGISSAYVAEREDGDFTVWNCRVRVEEFALRIWPAEDVVTAVHLNLRSPRNVIVKFAGGIGEVRDAVGLRWVLSPHCNDVQPFQQPMSY